MEGSYAKDQRDLDRLNINDSPLSLPDKFEYVDDNPQPTQSREEPMYGELKNRENLNTSIYDDTGQRNLPKRLRGMTPLERKLHILFFVALLSCLIFTAFVICVVIWDEA